MTTKIQLTPAQHAILAYAHNHSDGKIVWFPDNIKGGARREVLDGMFNRALITSKGDDWFVTIEGYEALARARCDAMCYRAAARTEELIRKMKLMA